MPRSKSQRASEPKRRSRTGCWPCKARKVKCGEEKPQCLNCLQHSSSCDYSIRLNWGGRSRVADGDVKWNSRSYTDDPSTIIFPTPEELTGHRSPSLVRSTHDYDPKSPNRGSRSRGSPTHYRYDCHQDDSSTLIRQVEGRSYYTNAQSLERVSQSDYQQVALSPPDSSKNDGMSQATDNSNIKLFRNHNFPLQDDSVSPSTSNLATPESQKDGRLPHESMATGSSPLIVHSPPTRNVFDTRSTLADNPDPRRLSVQSLLVDPEHIKPRKVGLLGKYPLTIVAEESTTYGYDLGLPDLDTPRNDDLSAILPYSPPTRRESVLEYLNANGETEWDESPFNPFSASSKVIAFEPGGYYADPVPIKIPFAFEQPLPPKLLENKMNLLYFHHFLNHTARILAPHDCSLNPFRTVLPEMAVRDESLMNLLLAYSASHRARLLHQPEPANRIAVYVKDVFPKLRESLTTGQSINTSMLATAIMLASLEILSPGAFGVGVPWNHHLSIARQMIVARNGIQVVSRSDKYSYFLIRWFAYLDIMGSLCGRTYPGPLSLTYWNDDDPSVRGGAQIDCLLGFTTDCVRILARVSQLCKQCESERINTAGDINESWSPSAMIVTQAKLLKYDIYQARTTTYEPCPYGDHSTESDNGWNALEVTNEMFQWAALIHLNRRVLNVALNDTEVQHAVQEIVGGLYKIRPGSTAEANILNPLFIAGAHALDRDQRERIMERLKVVETFGMSHMTRAKSLMQKVWDTGQAWESLVDGEFLG